MFLTLTWAFSGFLFTALTLCTPQLVVSFYLDLLLLPAATTMVTSVPSLPFLRGFTKKKKREKCTEYS